MIDEAAVKTYESVITAILKDFNERLSRLYDVFCSACYGGLEKPMVFIRTAKKHHKDI